MVRPVLAVLVAAILGGLPGCASEEHKASGDCRIEILHTGCPTVIHVGDPGSVDPMIRMVGGCTSVAIRGFIDATDKLGVPVGQIQVSSTDRVPESGILTVQIPDRLIERAGVGGTLKIRLTLSPGDPSNPGEEITETIEVLAR